MRCNYSDEERLVLVRYLGLIKGLADVLLRADASLAAAVARAVHDDTQQMVQVYSREVLRFADQEEEAGLARLDDDAAARAGRLVQQRHRAG